MEAQYCSTVGYYIVAALRVLSVWCIHETCLTSFAVRALYDYTAIIEEEFDFRDGDIIAVTSTSDDGWWTGKLVDETHWEKGRNVFPSNFVVLF